MRRTLAASTIPALAIAASWLRLEEPRRTREVVAVVLLALAPALLPHARQRLVAALGAVLGAAWIAFGAQPWELLPFRDEHVFGPILDSVERGLSNYYSVVLPFDAGRHSEMHALVVVAVFAFVLATCLLVAARRILLAAAVAVAGAGWPATLIGTDAIAAGALALAAALSIPLALRSRSAPALATGATLAALVVASAAWASSATTFAREAALDWTKWNLGASSQPALGVRFIWDSNYGGISFPPTRTAVLEISASDRAQYWRASTLDTFYSDRWFEDLDVVQLREASGAIPLDKLAPAQARDPSKRLEQRVEVKALVDERVVAAGTPVALEARSLGSVFFFSGGVVRSQNLIERGTRYRVWSYAPDPSPAALSSAPARYPRAARRFLEVWGHSLPPFRVHGRDARLRDLLSDPSFANVGAYRPLYAHARRIAGHARSPYAAVLALESWFRQRGGFRYEERPPRSRDAPPLVSFVTTTRAGYCQHFAGAMAVMLRFLGIPARVAVGFTSGRYEDGAWIVTDHDAHAWVEVWFPGEGWVPFDPTPGRGRFAGIYSFASDSPEALASLRRGELDGSGTRIRNPGPDIPDTTLGARRNADNRPSLVGLVLLLGGLGAGVIGVGKWSRRRSRYLTSDPRAKAAASLSELEAFLRDQGIVVRRFVTLDDLKRALADVGVDGRAFVDAAGRARFGPPGDAAFMAGTARRELRALLRGLRRQLSAWARLRGFVSLRSVRG
jgi:transglutaminase-like putative cysteine protease